MSGVVAHLLVATGVGLSAAGWCVLIMRWSQPGVPHQTCGFWAVSSLAGFIADVLTGDTGWAIVQGVSAAIWTWMWWRGHRKGRMKKAAKALGEKSRARVQALADRLERSPIPVPGGAS
jgi:membrane associated rhomboid family serine protease